MTEPAVRADGLTKHYGEDRAVQDLDLAIEPGTVYGFLGPNGAGKTTTMRLLTSLTRPTAGTATVGGVSIADRRALTARIGYLPHDPPVHGELTGREQLQYVARLQELPPDAAAARIDELLQRFGLAGDADRRISGYSEGMRKKVGVIAAVLHDPEVVFLDEPTSGLDPRAARVMRETIADLADRSMTVFLSTHILPVVEDLADGVGVIHDGRLVAEGSPAELTRRAEAAAGSEDAADLETAFIQLTTEETERVSERPARV